MKIGIHASSSALLIRRLAVGCLSVFSLAGCASTQSAGIVSHPLNEQQNIIVDAAVLQAENSQVALVTALSEITPPDRSFAYAPDVDISVPVSRGDVTQPDEVRLQQILVAAGLSARDVGSVIYVSRAGAPPPAEPVSEDAQQLQAAPKETVTPPREDNTAVRLGPGTLMNAPVLAAGENIPPAPHSAPEIAESAEPIISGPDSLASAEPLIIAPETAPEVLPQNEAQPSVSVPEAASEVAMSVADKPARRNWSRRSVSEPAATVSAPMAVAGALAPEAPVAAAEAPQQSMVEAPVVSEAQEMVEAVKPNRRNWARREAPEEVNPSAQVSAAQSSEEVVLAHASSQPAASAAPAPVLPAPESVTPPAAPLASAPAAAAVTAPVVATEPVTAEVVATAPAAPPAALMAPPSPPPAPSPRDSLASPVVSAVEAVDGEAEMTMMMGVDVHPSGKSNMRGSQSWIAERGQTLRSTLQTWSERAGVQLVWRSEYDYPLAASLDLSGDYESAVRTLLTGFAGAAPQPYGQLYRQGNSGNNLLIITSRGNDYAE